MLEDYVRQGLHSSKTWEIRHKSNKLHTLCTTYSEILCVPKDIQDEQLQAAVQYRSRGRLPALSWRHPMNGAPMCRASQPMSGISGLTGLSMSTVTDLYFGETTTHDTEDTLLLEAIRMTVAGTWRNIPKEKEIDVLITEKSENITKKVEESDKDPSNEDNELNRQQPQQDDDQEQQAENEMEANESEETEENEIEAASTFTLATKTKTKSIPIKMNGRTSNSNTDSNQEEEIARSSSIGRSWDNVGGSFQSIGSFGIQSIGSSSQGSYDHKPPGKSPRGSWISVSENHIDHMRRVSRSGLSMLLDEDEDQEVLSQSSGSTKLGRSRDRRVSYWDHVSSRDHHQKQELEDNNLIVNGIEVQGMSLRDEKEKEGTEGKEEKKEKTQNENQKEEEKETHPLSLSSIDPMCKTPTLHIVDARPYINAVGNAFMGKGVEDCTHRLWTLYFANMENIHHVRSSLDSMLEACGKFTDHEIDEVSFDMEVNSSLWMTHLERCLVASVHVADVLDRECEPMLIHCSDGWDRTAQLTSLGQILLDPFYRTIVGFITLVEKEWLSFGHQFEKRNGSGIVDGNNTGSSTIGWHSNNRRKHRDERSPVFIQFLDCVHQLVHQLPTCFEFNLRFLETIARHSSSGWYSTFRGNCEKDRQKNGGSGGPSLWDMMMRNNTKYLNVEYCRPPTSDMCTNREDYREKCVLPTIVTSCDRLQVWDALYFGKRKRRKNRTNEDEDTTDEEVDEEIKKE